MQSWFLLHTSVFSVISYGFWCFFFFFQAEDGIRDDLVTGVQTCALPISGTAVRAQDLPLPVVIAIGQLPAVGIHTFWRFQQRRVAALDEPGSHRPGLRKHFGILDGYLIGQDRKSVV